MSGRRCCAGAPGAASARASPRARQEDRGRMRVGEAGIGGQDGGGRRRRREYEVNPTACGMLSRAPGGCNPRAGPAQSCVPVPSPESPLTEPARPSTTMYTSAVCGYCVAAKNFLRSQGQEWTEVRRDAGPAEGERMVALAGRTSVPQIFVGDVHVGGYDDMMAMHRAGRFEPLVEGKDA